MEIATAPWPFKRAPEPAIEHKRLEDRERPGRPNDSGQRGERTEVPVTSHVHDGVEGVASPEQAPHLPQQGHS